MARGGCRIGAGRKKGIPNILTAELREQINASDLISFLQDLVAGRIPEATVGERKDAAVALLRKILPDMSHQKSDIEVETFKPFLISRELLNARK